MKNLKLISFILFLLNFSLSAAGYSDGSWDYKLPDEIGNLFKTKEKTDRQYGKAGQLLKDVYAEQSRSETYSYTYDEVGNLIEKESITERWRYKWSQSGMLKKVLRPDGKHVDFTYDALGRRLTKTFNEETTHFVWDGNTPLHEWTLTVDETISTINEKGEKELNIPKNLTIWIFEDGTFIPMAKLQDGKSYSIITDQKESVIFNFHSFCEILKGCISEYCNVPILDAAEFVDNCKLFKLPVTTINDVYFFSHEHPYHWAMICYYGDSYWEKNPELAGIPEIFDEWKGHTLRRINLKKKCLFLVSLICT